MHNGILFWREKPEREREKERISTNLSTVIGMLK
jgi:hypothetical protein